LEQLFGKKSLEQIINSADASEEEKADAQAQLD
jgi:hypothetical protein